MLEARNAPAKPMLAVHAGSVRRQARLEINQPFVIPHPGKDTVSVEVRLFQQLAASSLRDDGASEKLCELPVKKADGSASTVKLRVRRDGCSNGNSGSRSVENPMSVTKDYLDTHHLQQRIQNLIQDVLTEQPEDPYRYMLEQLKKVRGGELQHLGRELPGGMDTKMVAAPLAPSVPRPEGAAPRPGRSFSGAKDAAGSKSLDKQQSQSMRASLNWEPQTALQAEARATVRLALFGKLCSEVAHDSLKEQARRRVAKSMAGSILNRASEKLVREASNGMDTRELARSSITMVLRNSAILLSPQYHRALVKWTAYVAFRGASRKIDETDHSRRGSLPMPIVYLDGGIDWGRALRM